MHIAKRCRETKTLVKRAQAEFLLMNLMTHVKENVSSDSQNYISRANILDKLIKKNNRWVGYLE